MQFSSALRPVLRWWWIVLLCVVGFIFGTYLVSTSRISIYSATATVLIDSGTGFGQTSLGDIQASRELGKTYVQLLQTSSLLDLVTARLDINETTEELRGKVKAESLSGTQILEIHVLDPVPESAAKLANAIASTFVIQQQDRQLGEIARLQAGLLQYGINDSSASITAQFAALDSLSVLEPARIPKNPVSPKPIRDAIMGGLLGLAIGSGIISLIAAFDSRVRSQEELTDIVGGTVLGILPAHSYAADNAGSISSAARVTQQGQMFNEAMRFIAINLQYNQQELDAPSVFVVTSARASEGKTSITANLGIALGQIGHDTIVVDMDFRRPNLHNVFQLENEQGVTAALSLRVNIKEVMSQTEHENLRVITTGMVPPDPIQLFRSKRMKELLDELKQEAEYIIIDSAPLLPVADTPALLLQSEATILVVDQSATKRRAIAQAANEVRSSATRATFTVLNRVSNRDGDLDGYGYGYGKSGYGYRGYGNDSASE